MVGRRARKVFFLFEDENGSFTEDPKFGTKLIGLVLKPDFVSEHEWGIKGIQKIFGLPRDKIDENTDIIGVDRYLAKKVPQNKIVHSFTSKGQKYHLLHVSNKSFYGSIKDKIKYIKRSYELYYDDNKITGAWDSESFTIVVPDSMKNEFDQLVSAIKMSDVCVGLFGSSNNPFDHSGLSVLIRSNLSENVIRLWEQDHVKKINLLKESSKTRIKEKLQKVIDADGGIIHSKVGYHALSPSWAKPNDKTKYKVIYWLNPYHQDINNYGWYTVEELLQWIDGKGPIVEKNIEN